MAKTLRYADATTRKFCSAEHIFATTRPNKYRDAIEILADSLTDPNPEIRLKAAEKIINHTKGTPKQSVDHTTNGQNVTTTPIFVTSDAELQKAIENYNPD